MISIKEFEYSLDALKEMEQWRFTKNWPLVYIMHNETDGTVVSFENGKDEQVLITRSNRLGETVIMSADMICKCLGI
jgi:hypothetical protein